MKVLCLSEMYPNIVYPYLGLFVHKQNEALKKRGVNIKVVSPVPWFPFPLSIRKIWDRFKQIPYKEILDEIEIYHTRRIIIPKKIGYHLNAYTYFFSIFKLIKKIKKEFDFDIIHSHQALPDGLVGSFLKKEFNKPLVVTIHGKDIANDQWSTIHISHSCKKAVFDVFQSSSKIVGVSNYIKNSILNFYPNINSKKIAVIHGGISEIKRTAQNKKDKKIVILSVGALIPLKGHKYTIKAMKEVIKAFPNCQLIIVGEGKEKNNLVHQVNSLGLRNIVNIINFIPQEQLLELMASADIFVLPSWAEGFGLVYLEAMSHGIPVIGCKGQGIEDIVVHGETGFLVEPKNSEEISNIILSLIKNEELRNKIGKRGQEIVTKYYKWEDNAEKYIRLYSELLGC